MSQDNVSLLVNGQKIENFESYTVESNLFEAADAFSLEVSNPQIEIQEGQECTLEVNDQIELTGIIDQITESHSKGSHTFTIAGRDLMGLVVDSYVGDFEDHENITLQGLAELLLAFIPFINRQNIVYGKGSKTQLKPTGGSSGGGPLGAQKASVHIEPGQTVFEVLAEYALSVGLLFFNLPDGTFVFGEPITSGKSNYNLICRKNGQGTNIKRGTRTIDISQRYKRIKVIAQQQGSDPLFGAAVNIEVVLADPEFPFEKPYVEQVDGIETRDQALDRAALILGQQYSEGFQLEYVVKGHSQNGLNYQVNTIAHVIDEILTPQLQGDFLIYARTFERSKSGGTITTLKLSELGVRA